MKGKDWIVRLICCGRDDGTYEATSWAEADSFRASYVNAIGHERSAIIERAHTDSGADEERSAPPPAKMYCDRCDGCGWYEGGPTIRTTCEQCGGTGVVSAAAQGEEK